MNSSKLTERFESALIYATRLHANQTRKISGVPYTTPFEDQGDKTIRENIRQRFGESIVTIIDGCTEWDTPPKPSWLERKQRYLQHLRHASSSVRLVSCMRSPIKVLCRLNNKVFNPPLLS